MAYAIFMKKTKTMDYNFKDFEICQWKLYMPYTMLKHMPKGVKAAKREQGELKRQAFRDAERERRAKRIAEKEDGTQDCLKDITNEIAQVRDCLDLFKHRMAEKNAEKNQRMVEKNQRMIERNQRIVEKNEMMAKKNEMMAKKNQIKAITNVLKAETDSKKRKCLIARLSNLSE
jgi:hypothetical protein